MTKEEFEKLADGEKVWYSPTYFAFPMLGVIRTIAKADGVWGEFSRGGRGVWVNFFGDGQCLFTPPPYGDRWYTWVTPCHPGQ